MSFFLANSTNQFITLEFKTLNTECSYDYVFVYDGDSFNSPLLGSFSGKNQPQSVLASSGFVSIFFYTLYLKCILSCLVCIFIINYSQ